MTRVGLLGGTFDPPHLGHLKIAEKVLHALALDEIWFIPTYDPPLKNRVATDSSHRKKMLERMLSGDDRPFCINDIELRRKEKSYTIHTVKQLKERYPETEFYFIIGGDQVTNLDKWEKINELMELIQFVAIERIGYEWKDVPGVEKLLVDIGNISSTEIRSRISKGRPFKHLVDEKVYEYIKEYQLYGYESHR